MLNKLLKRILLFSVFLIISYLLYVFYSIMFSATVIVPYSTLGIIHGAKSDEVIVIGKGYYYLDDPISNIYEDLNYENISRVMEYDAEHNGSFIYIVQNSFKYDYSRSLKGNLHSSIPPSQMLKRSSGVCGDFAFLYAAYFLGKYSTATLVFITANGWTYGHIFAAYDGTAYDITIEEPLSEHIAFLTNDASRFTLATMVLTMNSGTVGIKEISVGTYTNNFTAVLPEYISGTVTIVSGTITKVRSMIPIKVLPTTVAGGRLVMYGMSFLASSNSITFYAGTKTVMFIIRSPTFTTVYLLPSPISTTRVSLV